MAVFSFWRERAAAKWLARMGNESAAFDRAEFESWRKHPANARAFDEVARTWELVIPVWATRDQLDGAEDLASNVLPVHGSAKPRRTTYAALAAVLLAAAAGVGFERVGMFRSSSATGSAQIANTVRTGSETGRSFRLSDGSVVALGASSELSIGYSKMRRNLTLVRGSAHFEVAHDTNRPFVVRAGESVVTARGTAFDIRFTANGVRIALLRGAIDVERVEANTRVGDRRRLAPGDTLLIPNRQQPGKVASVPSAQPGSGAMLTFDAVAVPEAVAIINRRNARKIIVVGTRLTGETVTGGFRADDPDGFARMIAALFDLRITADTNRTASVTTVRALTSLDITARYRTRSSGVLGGLDLTFGVQNFFNTKPGTVAGGFLDAPYDSTNYSPIGRYVSFSVAKKW